MTPAPLSLTTCPTADLGHDGLVELRAFLDTAFGPAADGHFSDEDWGHTLGGLHVLARRDGVLVGHAGLVGRQLRTAGRMLRTGYVEAVAVAAAARRQGVAGAVMTEVERLVRGGSELGALAASADGEHLYRARGWTRWTGPLQMSTPDGGVRDGDDSWVFVLPTPSTGTLDPTLPLVCDWRRGDSW